MALEAIEGARKINPRLVLDMFNDYVTKPLSDPIMKEDEQVVINYAKEKINSQFNEISPSLIIFDRHWSQMTSANQKVIWQWLKTLIVLASRV